MPGYRHKQVGNSQAANRIAAKILKANQTSQQIQITDQQHQLLQQYYTQYNQLKYVVYNKWIYNKITLLSKKNRVFTLLYYYITW